MRWTPKEKGGWHLWFAWFPIELENGTCVWLETVECCAGGTARRTIWVYRLPGSNDRAVQKPVAIQKNLTSTRASARTGTDIPSDPGVEP